MTGRLHSRLGAAYEGSTIIVSFYGEAFSTPRPTHKLEDHPLLAVRDCLLNIFLATLQTGGRFYIHNLRTDIIRIINSRRMRWAERVERMGDTRGVYRVLMGRSEGKRPLGRPRRKCEDNIKTDIQEVGWRGMDWIDLAQDRGKWLALVNAVMNCRVA